jgi:hypothetical protein
VLLMKQQAVLRRQLGGARFRMIFTDAAQRFENVAAGFREVRGHFHELPSSKRQAVGPQDLDAFRLWRREHFAAQVAAETVDRLCPSRSPGSGRPASLPDAAP